MDELNILKLIYMKNYKIEFDNDNHILNILRQFRDTRKGRLIYAVVFVLRRIQAQARRLSLLHLCRRNDKRRACLSADYTPIYAPRPPHVS